MAAGDLTLFDEFALTLGQEHHNLSSDTIKLALVTNAVVPTAADVDPELLDYTEVSGTNYTAGGETVTCTWAMASGEARLTTATVPSWTQHASGPTNIRWGILYNDTATNDKCIAFIEFGSGSDISLADGDISYTFNATAIFGSDTA